MENTSVTENQMERTLGIYRGLRPCTVWGQAGERGRVGGGAGRAKYKDQRAA